MRVRRRDVEQIYRQFAREAPALFDQPTDRRVDESTHVVDRVFVKNGVLIDLGGGLNPLNGVLASLGMSVTVLDIFEHDLAWVRASGENFLEDSTMKKAFLERVGVTFIECDVCSCDLRSRFTLDSVDAITSYHCLEHLHQSPKKVLESALAVLKVGGSLLIEVPNAVNLLKRFKVLMGKTNYAPYGDYYDSINFTGHIREYSVSDLSELAANLELKKFNVYGKNWYGTLYEKLGYGAFGKSVGGLLERFPGFCGSLFMYHKKVGQ